MTKRSYLAIGVLTLIAVVCLVLAMPDQIAALRAAVAAPPMSPVLSIGSAAGFIAWLWAVVAMVRGREFGWALASVVLSYLAVGAWVIRGLASRAPRVA